VTLSFRTLYSILLLTYLLTYLLTVDPNITQQNPTLKLITQFASLLSSVVHTRGHSGITIKIFSSVKNMKATADAGKRRINFRARVRRNAQFATVSSCARRFFKHLKLEFWRIIRYTEEWRIPVSRGILSVVLWIFGAHSWLKINLLTKSM